MNDRSTSDDGEQHFNPEELFTLLVESVTGFAIFTTDLDGLVTSWNVGCEKLIGFSEQEIIGRTADVIFVEEDRAAGAPDLEREQASQTGRADDERWHRRKDGSVFWASGLMMPLRGCNGFVKIMRDRTDKHLANERLAASEERFRMLTTNIPQLVFRTYGSGARSWGSPQWEIYAGLSDAQSREFGWLEAVHPDDRAHTMTSWNPARETGLYSVEHRIRRHANGEYRWHQTRAVPTPYGRDGETEWVGTSTDIHELRSLQSRQQILVAELQHRTRNLLALVQAIIRRTLRDASSLAEFATEYEDRLIALSRVQGLIASTPDGMLPLRIMIEAELNAHGAHPSDRVRITGPDVDVPLTSAQTLALAIHELATNAVKHGAIGQLSGQLEIVWRLEPGDPSRLILEWAENGVTMPDPARPKRKGYGSELIEKALPYQLDAETRLSFGPQGIHCIIDLPIATEREKITNA